MLSHSPSSRVCALVHRPDIHARLKNIISSPIIHLWLTLGYISETCPINAHPYIRIQICTCMYSVAASFITLSIIVPTKRSSSPPPSTLQSSPTPSHPTYSITSSPPHPQLPHLRLSPGTATAAPPRKTAGARAGRRRRCCARREERIAGRSGNAPRREGKIFCLRRKRLEHGRCLRWTSTCKERISAMAT
jgi:hypothetical protein